MRIMDNIIVGKFLTTDGTIEGLDKVLSQYNLVCNKEDEGFPNFVRRKSDLDHKDRYDVIFPYLDEKGSTDLTKVVVGEWLSIGDYALPKGMPYMDICDIKEPLENISKDIPDAHLIILLWDQESYKYPK